MRQQQERQLALTKKRNEAFCKNRLNLQPRIQSLQRALALFASRWLDSQHSGWPGGPHNCQLYSSSRWAINKVMGLNLVQCHLDNTNASYGARCVVRRTLLGVFGVQASPPPSRPEYALRKSFHNSSCAIPFVAGKRPEPIKKKEKKRILASTCSCVCAGGEARARQSPAQIRGIWLFGCRPVATAKQEQLSPSYLVLGAKLLFFSLRQVGPQAPGPKDPSLLIAQR